MKISAAVLFLIGRVALFVLVLAGLYGSVVLLDPQMRLAPHSTPIGR